MPPKAWCGTAVVFAALITTTLSVSCGVKETTYERVSGYKMADGDTSTARSSTQCYALCTKEAKCRGYSMNHIKKLCIITWYPTAGTRSNQSLVQDENWSFHRKICLTGVQNCVRHWAFERVPRFAPDAPVDLILRNITSYDQCLQACVRQDSFQCRSVAYDIHGETCALSAHDRRTVGGANKSVMQRSILYSEHQCVADPPRCRYQPLSGRAVSKVYVDTRSLTHNECEDLCMNHTDFICRSFVYDQSRKLCLLSPDDSHSAGPTPAEKVDDENLVLFERTNCIDVEMRCEATAMTALIQVTPAFRGRVYVVGHASECFSSSVSPQGYIALTVPLHGRQCGTKNLGNGTFLNSIIVQHHPYVLLNTDRRIDITCNYEEVKMKLRGGKNVLEGDLQSLTQVVTGLAETPPVRLEVVNSTGHQVAGVELGDPLFLKAEMLDESVFGIFGSGLIARSGDGSETVLLLDEKGCPAEPSVFPGFQIAPKGKSLVAPFQAFRFATDSTVKFQMTVSFCLDICPPPKCGPNGGFALNPNSWKTQSNRTRRSVSDLRASAVSSGAQTGTLNVQPGDVVTDVTMESTLFVVNGLKAVAELDEIGASTPLKDGRRHRSIVDKTEHGFCFSRPIFYTFAVGIALFQAVLVVAWIVLVTSRWDGRTPLCGSWPWSAQNQQFRKRQRHSAYMASCASVSSKTDLFGSSPTP